MVLTDESVRLAVDTAPCGIAVCTESGTIVFVNRPIETILGWTAAELVGRSIEDCLPSASGRLLQLAIERSEPASEDRDVVAGRRMTGRTKDGSETSLVVSLAPARSESGGRLVVL